MTQKKLIIAALILASLFAFKAVFPEVTGNMIQKAEALFSRDIDYRQVLTDIGDYISVFREEKEESDEAAETYNEMNDYSFSHIPARVEHGSYSFAELAVEAAVNEGEDFTLAEEDVPEAVSVFLESQKAYSDYAVPEDVSYDYCEFPTELCVPVAGYNSSGFGYRKHPIHGDVRFHYGTDFAAWSGEDIYAFADGTVSFAGYCDSYGNYITIDHADGWQSLYAHCSVLYVESGDEVRAGEKIALVGDTGLVTGPHLHFELTREGVYINPEYYVN